MTKRSVRFQGIVRLAEQKSREGARVLAFVQQRLVQEEQRLRQLEDYQAEYRGELASRGRAGLMADQVRQYSGFLQNLDIAIQQQKRQVATAASQLEQVRDSWRQLEARHKGFVKVLEGIRGEEESRATRREQILQDEFAARRPGRKLGR